MSTRVDAVGNIIGRRQADVPGTDRVLLLGSHLDTVPNAGKYDGIVGVLIALAVVEQLREDRLPFAVDVIGFSEEEGVRFALPFIGSKAVVGDFDPTWLSRTDSDGVTLEEAIRRFGLDPTRIGEAAYSKENVVGYLEPHIEQGPVLEKRGISVGVVDSIVGQSRLVVRLTGVAGHAGTVPMEMRRDALAGAASMVTNVREIGNEVVGLRATVGRLVVSPNASNVIPSQVDFSLDIRHADDQVRLDAVNSILEYARGVAEKDDLVFEILSELRSSSVQASAELVSAMEHAIQRRGLQAVKLPSGAGHDAMIMASRFPMAMLFIRHPGGISHHPDEYIEACDVQTAIDVLVETIRKLAQESL